MTSKEKIISIAAGVLVVILLIGIGALAFLNLKQSGRAARLRDALVQVATTAGVQELKAEASVPAAAPTEAPAAAPAEGSNAAPAEASTAAPAEPQKLTADALKDAAVLSSVLQQVQAAIQGAQQELTTAKEALATTQAEASGAKAEVATLTQGAQEQTTKVESLTKDLAAKDEAITAAKAAAEKAAQDMQAAQETADKQKAELEASVESLKAQMAEESARLQAELEAAHQPASEAAAEPAAVSPSTEGESPTETVATEAAAEEPVPESEAKEDPGRIVGQSQMISLIRYSEVNQALFLRLRDGQTMSYQEVPMDVYSQLVDAPEKMDMDYRFKIQGAFKSIPPDSIVVRKFWKWQRRHPGTGDVRVIEPELVPVVEAEAAPAEASAETAAPAAEAPAEAAPAGK